MLGKLPHTPRRDAPRMATSVRTADRDAAVLTGLLDEAPLLVRRSDSTGGADWFNSTWLRYTGRSLDAELGNGWLRGLHPVDRECYLHAAGAALEQRRGFCVE